MTAESVPIGGYGSALVTMSDGSQAEVPVTLMQSGVYEAEFVAAVEGPVTIELIPPAPKQKNPPRRKETPEYRGFLLRALRAYARRVGEQGDTTELPEMVKLADAVEAAVAEAVQGLNDRGFSWAEIGDAVGMRRQHAWRRWHRKDELSYGWMLPGKETE